jgi:putative membrane protein
VSGLGAVDASWTFNPGPLLLVGTVGALYLRRWLTVRRTDGPRGAGGWRLVSFLAGLVAVLAALVSPLDALGEQLFAMHMGQHILLLDLAPILCTLGLTKAILRPVTKRVHRIERAAGPLAHPAFAVILYAATIWAWHIPALYDAALTDPVVHGLEHVSFGVAGTLFWWHLLSPIRTRFRQGAMAPLLYLAATKLLVGALGMGLTFSPDVLYPYYEQLGTIWGLSPLASQQVGGGLMTVEQESVLGIVLFALFFRALDDADRRDVRAERLRAG